MLSLISFAQGNDRQGNDLKGQWLVNQSGQLFRYDNQATTSIFFWVDGKRQKGNRLSLYGKHPYSVFVDGKLISQNTGKANFSIDSLSKIYSHQLFIGLFSPQGVSHLFSEIESKPSLAQDALVVRKGSYFLDFTILASLLLIIGFILFLRTNAMLTLDYLDFKKLFSFQDRDESTLTLRIASSVNILIYLFASFFLGLLLLASFHLMGSRVSLTQQFLVQSTALGFWQWTVLSSIVFGLLIAKLFWLVLLSALFGFRDTVRIQFFNFVRVILSAVTLLAAISLVYFIFNIREQNYFFHLLTILSIVFTIGVVATYFKLTARMPFHFFHLFSYLCASEIIPLMVLIKVFFY
jgi:hypothetical protein